MPYSSLTARIVAVAAALATALFLSSCSKPAFGGRTELTSTDPPRITGTPAGYNADDVAFANNMITHHEQGINLSVLGMNRSADADVTGFAAKTRATLESDIAVLRVLLVQWNENPDTKTGGVHGATLRGMVDALTMAQLASLHGTEFDKLWLQSMITLSGGAIEMANAEMVDGKNIDAVGLAKEVIKAQQAQIQQINQMLGG
ncbi:DUF305 domain-containing protein [uncultured Mycobacterium sp.]|uniref:DUF305 domain-containing protein n=1 Tax=uncultured Mycobacterium sp. TaxID=171292 RepID=UPI0035C953CF